MITLYDYETRLPGKTISPWAMKVRLALNYKGLPHKTVWFGPFDMEERAKALGLPANTTEKHDNGTYGRYTVPIIHDPSTGKSIADSNRIIEYLDEAYPDSPRIITPGTKILAGAYEASILSNVIFRVYPVIGARVATFMEPNDEVQYIHRLSSLTGTNVQELAANQVLVEECWKKAEEGLSMLDAQFRKAELTFGAHSEGVEGGFIEGRKLGLADISLAAMLIWMKRGSGEDSEKWRLVETWNEGRWAKHLESMRPFSEIHE